MKEILKKYLESDNEVPAKKVNLLYFIIFYTVYVCIGTFTTWVKNAAFFDMVNDNLEFIIVFGIFGNTAFDVFRHWKRGGKGAEQVDPEEPQEPEPVKPEPAPQPEPTVKKVDAVDLDFIKKHEGVKLEAYKCPGGIWTIGAGSTYHPNGAPVKKGDVIEPPKVDQYLVHEAATRLAMMNLPDSLNHNQKTALLSFQYNVGHGNWLRSTLRKKVLANPKDESIRAEFMKWNKSQGRVLPGLTKRRKEEADLFFS
jgi:lysozyme